MLSVTPASRCEFGDRHSFSKYWDWATRTISDFDSLGVYTKVSINCCQEISDTYSPLHDLFTATICGANDLSSSNAASAE
jgi:hypothetical protein